MKFYKTSDNEVFAFEDNINDELLTKQINKFTLTAITETEKNTILGQNQMSEYDLAISNLRFDRDILLAKTDWSALSDNTMSDAMKTYRQQLRDATEGLDTVEKVQAYEFPEEVLN